MKVSVPWWSGIRVNMRGDALRRSRNALVPRRLPPPSRSARLVMVGAAVAAVMAGCGGPSTATISTGPPVLGFIVGSVIAYGGPAVATSRDQVHPQPHARIEVRQGNDLVTTTRTGAAGADGTFRIGVRPGTYTVGSLDGCIVHARVVVKSAATSTVHLSCAIP